ncbi:hypothetical protein FA15DRAFT_660705 [Coprinopsis marcescibilis]|uniref:Uncharacterized protein n=1 Tax=Coprinopsis marcescibilis TaxID=230819 RepID=A0A5C3KEF5_COPMA|nr:hypothetical protein FA15DRAFT_660705 [Coprinopsis marcescibilis]
MCLKSHASLETFRAIHLRTMLDFIEECYNECDGNPSFFLHYDAKRMDLVPYFLPSKPNSNKPVDPGMLVQFKEEHKILWPNCLCAFLDRTEYTECKLVIVNSDHPDPFSDDYISFDYAFQCARKHLRLNRFIQSPRLITQHKDRRCERMGQNLNGEGLSTSVTRSRLYPPTPPSNSPKKAFRRKKDDLARKMAKAVEDLRCLAGNGVPEQSFSTLFTQCLLCDFVVPIHLEIPHVCERKPLKREHDEEADNEGQSTPSRRKRHQICPTPIPCNGVFSFERFRPSYGVPEELSDDEDLPDLADIEPQEAERLESGLGGFSVNRSYSTCSCSRNVIKHNVDEAGSRYTRGILAMKHCTIHQLGTRCNPDSMTIFDQDWKGFHPRNLILSGNGAFSVAGLIASHSGFAGR